ncbi:MAG: transporter substrate-binding domain-containing protein [Legionellaceae bacterium]|nr:transporter substrate-binding domain-containing protein [Legionellaceae bacterium]
MKKWLLFCVMFCTSLPLLAEKPPLRVALTPFAPPFVMQTNTQQFHGFDIEVIEYVCKKLERRCEYIPMTFSQLIPALVEGKADVAIGGIIITLPRSRLVRFSTPYMVSKVQFVGTQAVDISPPFELKQLSKKRIGVLTGGGFARLIRNIDIDKPKLVSFKEDSEIIHALHTNRISLALLTTPKAHYWKSNAADSFQYIGNPFPVGFGFAVAINPNEASLIKDVDLALLDYQDSDNYKTNYNLYIRNEF